MRSSSTASQRGREYEAELAKRVGGKEVPLSGAGFSKLDVANGPDLLWSAKWTGHASFRLSLDLFKEIRAAIDSPGGIGGETIGVVVVKMEPEDQAPEEVVCIKMDDFMALFASGKKVIADAPEFTPLQITTRRRKGLLEPTED